MHRERFLDDIAARLGRPRVSTQPSRAVQGPLESYVADPLRGGATLDRIERFQHEVALVGGKVTVAASLNDVKALLREELALLGAKRIVTWAPSEFATWKLDRELDQLGCVCFSPAHDRHDFREVALAADVGITTVAFAIANTGTLAVPAGPGRPRAVSLLPTVHLALVRESQLVDRLGLGFARDPDGDGLGSAMTFVTGPSRTSDIENDLSIGVHGPAAVSIVLWRDGAPGAAS